MADYATLLRDQVTLTFRSVDRIFFNFILSFRVSQGCDLRRPVMDSVLNGTAAA